MVETRSAPASLAATRRSFTFYVALPGRSVLWVLHLRVHWLLDVCACGRNTREADAPFESEVE